MGLNCQRYRVNAGPCFPDSITTCKICRVWHSLKMPQSTRTSKDIERSALYSYKREHYQTQDLEKSSTHAPAAAPVTIKAQAEKMIKDRTKEKLSVPSTHQLLPLLLQVWHLLSHHDSQQLVCQPLLRDHEVQQSDLWENIQCTRVNCG